MARALAPAPPMTPLARRLRSKLVAIDDVVESPGIFGEGEAFWVNGKQIVHWDSDSQIQLRLTRPLIRAHRERLAADPRIAFRSKSSDWIHASFSTAADLPFVVELAELATAAHRPTAGTPSTPPPIGPALERRRRFH